MKEKEIELCNVNTASLKMLFLFIYKGIVIYFIQAAHYFAIDKLIELCSNSIVDVLDPDNFPSVAEFSLELNFVLLFERCLKFKEIRANKVVFTVGLSFLSLTVMLAVTKSCKLQLGTWTFFLLLLNGQNINRTSCN